MVPMDVVGVRMEMPSNTPIVLLRETEGERYLPIWVGAVEATAIAYAQQGVLARAIFKVNAERVRAEALSW